MKKLLAIVGPTASGKTLRAVDMARHMDAEIISADSRQVYREMDLGTGKDLDEYGDVPYHLIDIADAGDKYNLHQYLRDFNATCREVTARGKNIIVCGGSGLYVESALNGIIMPEVGCNPELRKKLSNKSLAELTQILSAYKTLHNTTDVDTVQRAVRAIEIEDYYACHPEEAELSRKESARKLPSVIIGIDIPREIRRRRISERLDQRIADGMIEEVRLLIEKGVKPENLIYYGLEYKYLTLHVLGKISFNEMHHSLEIAIHQFAKRQMTWFRGMERRGFKINWIPYDVPREEFTGKVIEIYRSSSV